MTIRAWKIVSVAVVATLALTVGLSWYALRSFGAAIEATHIEGSVPSSDDFDPALRGQLVRYFWAWPNEGKTLEYELLRDGPTQSGIGAPKFYVWVRVRSQGSVEQEGAVRLAATNGGFSVTHFVPRSAIVADPSRIRALFPEPVRDRIYGEINRDSLTLVGVQ